jgi:hypothetical protein
MVIGSEDIVDGNPKLVLGLVSLKARSSVSRTSVDLLLHFIL